jgi:hypothetical protein
MDVPKSQSEQLMEMALAKIFESSKEYRVLAKEFLHRADALEGEALKVAVMMKQKENDVLHEAHASGKK